MEITGNSRSWKKEIKVVTTGNKMIELTLPWPPTVNTYWRNFNGRTLLSAKGREYQKAVADQVLIQRGAKHYDFALKVTIEAFRPDRRRRDLDNLLKAVLDGLAHAGVMEDDCLIVDLRIFWAEEIGGMVKVTIEGAE
jgi:crossover junction endodeoxyribonuclease RusA